MTRDEAKEQFAGYAIGALDAAEARAVESFLHEASAEERRELADWHEVAASLPLALAEIAPPVSVRARLLDRIAAEIAPVIPAMLEPAVLAIDTAEPTARILPFRSARRPAPPAQRWLLMAASILLACTSAILFWRNIQVAGERDDLVAQRDRIAGELDRERGEKKDLYASLNASSKIVPMVAGKETPQANAKVVWDTKQQVWKIFIIDLPAPPDDKDYQLWYVTKSRKISAKVFRPESNGHTVLTLSLPREALTGGLAATAVTLEPKGGSPQPTSNLYLLGQI